jgi:hypothetical protein
VNSPGLDGVVLRSGGCRLIGGLYRAGGEGRHPAVLFLHGIPGHEKNIDLAMDLRDRGMHCLYIHYRGSWGSEGDYHIPTQVDDARVAFEWLASHPLVDAARIALVGLSLGGWVALMLASRTKGVKAVVALSPLIDPANTPIKVALLEEFAESVRGISPETLVGEWQALSPITAVAGRLGYVPILLVTADGDEIFPPSHYAALPALPCLTRVRFPRADHVFSDVRSGLRHVVGGWLLEQLE